MSQTIETHQFQTEARELLQLMIHSVYSNKDVFLRELISNASDAMDRRRFESVQNPDLLPEGTELEIDIETDSGERTLTIKDRGIGMSRDEVKDLIGTIAKSGSKEFLGKLQQAKQEGGGEVPPELIGQFGVGFYSGFMVADRMTLVTRRAGEDTATRWESAGDGTYTLEETERDEPGSTITLHLKETDEENAQNDYTAEHTLRSIIKRYSDFVAYPIKTQVERTEIERDEEGKPVEGAEEKTVIEDVTLNSMKALWLKDKSDITDDELNEFYKHISHDWTDPLAHIHAKIEGTLEYRLLLYIPSRAPSDMFYRDQRYGLQLYVRRIFIMDDCTELVPEYLRFLRGVVDSEDLSLNISREILQQDRQIQRIKKGIVSKALDFLQQLADNDADKYKTFWNEFGRALKEGVYGDFENKDRILGMCRFTSTNDPAEPSSLQNYIDRMKTDQDTIYYMTGESRSALENSPHLEAFTDKGYEVLLLTDPVDEVWTQSTTEYEGKKFQNVSTGEIDLDAKDDSEEEKEKRDEQAKDLQPLLDYLKTQLEDSVKEVRVSKRLTASAACLVTDGGDMTPQMEQLMRAMNQEVPATKRVLEINANHPVVERLKSMRASNDDDLANRAQLLYGQALLAEGGQLPDPGKFAKLVADLMAQAT